MSQLFIRSIATFCLGLVLAGCSINVPAASDLPPAPREIDTTWMAPVKMPAPYRLQIGDVLDIKIMSNPELNDQVTVRPDGMISTMIAADIPAMGYTVSEVKAELQKHSGNLLKNPRIAVIVRSFAPNRVYVLGEVRNPGEFITVGPNLTMLQAVSRAGGLANTADPNNVVIIRRGVTETPQAFAADFKAAASGTDATADIRLAPYDVVFVPRSDAGDAYLDFQQYWQQFFPDVVSVGATHSF